MQKLICSAKVPTCERGPYRTYDSMTPSNLGWLDGTISEHLEDIRRHVQSDIQYVQRVHDDIQRMLGGWYRLEVQSFA
mgnify:CR=1 FL=1